MSFHYFIQLPTEIQGELLTYLRPRDWANTRRVSKHIGDICELPQVREHVFKSFTFPLSLPRELEFIRIRTEGKSYLDPEFLAMEGYTGYFLLGAAYNMKTWKIYPSWDEDKPVIYFAMFVYATEKYTRGINKLRLADGTDLYSSPLRPYPTLDGEWEKWKGQISHHNEDYFVIPCDIWLYPYNAEIYDEDEDEYYVVLKYDGLFPVLDEVKPIRCFADLKDLQSLV